MVRNICLSSSPTTTTAQLKATTGRRIREMCCSFLFELNSGRPTSIPAPLATMMFFPRSIDRTLEKRMERDRKEEDRRKKWTSKKEERR